MLLHLKIANLATFREVVLDLSPCLTCVTGETGSGKSLFVDALSFLSGQKNRLLFVPPGQNEGVVEAIFSPSQTMPVFLKDVVLPGDDWVLRRTLLANGRTRQQVNGTNITQSQLQELGTCLMDLVGQGEGFRLQNPRIHAEYLDSYGETLSLLDSYKQLREDYLEKKRLLSETEKQQSDFERRRERIREINVDRESLSPRPGEWVFLQTSLSVLLHTHDLMEAASMVYDHLYGSEESILGKIRKMSQDLDRLKVHDPRLGEVAIPLGEAYTLLKESAEESRQYLEGLSFDPEELGKTESRILEFQRLSRKYNVPPEELSEFFEKNALELLEEDPEYLQKMQKAVYHAADVLRDTQQKLSEKRKMASIRLSKEVTDRLPKLRLEKGIFSVNLIHSGGEFPPEGAEEVRFYFTANPDLPPKPLDQIASGGELSRILLVLKQLLAEKDSVETLVFDEVDSGIGGEVGETVGDILSEISNTRQVVAITHLHQVARKAGTHLVIQKREKEGVTESTVTVAEGESRVSEIARMLGGSDLAPSTMTLARELLLSSSSDQNRSASNRKSPSI